MAQMRSHRSSASSRRIVALTAVLVGALGVGAVVVGSHDGASPADAAPLAASSMTSLQPSASSAQGSGTTGVLRASLASDRTSKPGCASGTGATLVPCMPGQYSGPGVTDLATQLADARAQADTVAKAWLAGHRARNDAAFTTFALAKLGAPPAGATQSAEIAQLHDIAASRDKAGLDTSAWLETHGKKDVWKYFESQDRLAASKAKSKLIKNETKLAETLGQVLSDKAKALYKRTSPYQVDPTLDGQNQAKYSGQTRYSYPSSHAVIGAAEADLLGGFTPTDATSLRDLETQVDYSRMYAGGHYASDLVRGAFLGELLGDYVSAVMGGSHA